jgi:hypothetical protein
MRSAAARIGTHEGVACRRSTDPSRRAQRDPGRDLLPVWFCTPRGVGGSARAATAAPNEVLGRLSVVARVGPACGGVFVQPRGGRGIAEASGCSSRRMSRPGGGIGRRGRLKIGRPHGRVGSSPTPGIQSAVACISRGRTVGPVGSAFLFVPVCVAGLQACACPRASQGLGVLSVIKNHAGRSLYRDGVPALNETKGSHT